MCAFDISLNLFNKILFQLIELRITGYMKGTVKLCVSITSLNLFLIKCLDHYVFTFASEQVMTTNHALS